METNNNTYKVKPEDLIGEIEDFPIEIVQKMVDYQIGQGNKADVTVFQKSNMASKRNKGFDWNKTKENTTWIGIIMWKEFDIFFKHNPKE